MLKSFVLRGPSLVLVLLLSGCQAAPQATQLPVDDLVSAFRQLDQSLARGDLSGAESQLASLQQRASGDTRMEQYQRQLAEAHLQQGEQALKGGDLNGAAKALSRARSLMPHVPALTAGLDDAVAQAQEAELQAIKQAAAAAEAVRLEQAKQVRQAAAERQAAALKAASQVLAEPTAEPEPVPVKPQPRLIDTNASSSVVSIAMLDNQDNERLRSLLDQVAADVVNFNCAVRIEVREAKDYLWVASLLNARIKRLDPAFSARLSQVLKPQQVPQLVLSPGR